MTIPLRCVIYDYESVYAEQLNRQAWQRHGEWAACVASFRDGLTPVASEESAEVRADVLFIQPPDEGFRGALVCQPSPAAPFTTLPRRGVCPSSVSSIVCCVGCSRALIHLLCTDQGSSRYIPHPCMADLASSSEGSSFNITIDDTSPTIQYSQPAASQDVSGIVSGWVECLSGFGAPSCNGEGGANGTTLHATSANRATLGIEWVGECIVLHDRIPSARIVALHHSLDRPDACVNGSLHASDA